MNNFAKQLHNEIQATYSLENKNLKNLSSVDLFIHLGYPKKFLIRYQQFLKHSFPIAFPFVSMDIKNKTILDLGSGIGLDSAYAAENAVKQVISVDLSKSFLQNGFKNLKNKKIIGNMEELFFKNDSFDLIVMNGSLNLIVNKKSLLDELNGILKYNGYLIICDLFWLYDNKEREIYKNDINSWCWCVGGCLTEQELFYIAEQSGFTVKETVIYEKIDKLKRVRVVLKNGK